MIFTLLGGKSGVKWGGSWRKALYISAFVVSLSLADATDLRGQNSATPAFLFDNDAVVMPVGVYVLVRKGSNIGALKFTNISQVPDLIIGKATYESLYQGDGSGSLRKPNVTRRTGYIDIRQLSGLGRALAFQMGNDTIIIGPWKFTTLAPGRVDMYIRSWIGSGDRGFEFAPTSATTVQELDAGSRSLRWFKVGTDNHLAFPVSTLPK